MSPLLLPTVLGPCFHPASIIVSLSRISWSSYPGLLYLLVSLTVAVSLHLGTSVQLGTFFPLLPLIRAPVSSVYGLSTHLS